MLGQTIISLASIERDKLSKERQIIFPQIQREKLYL